MTSPPPRGSQPSCGSSGAVIALYAIQVMRAALSGRFTEAKRLIDEAEPRVGALQYPMVAIARLLAALPVHLMENRDRELWEEVERVIAGGITPSTPCLAVRAPARPRAAGPRLRRELAELDDLAAVGFRDLPPVSTTLFCLAVVAEVCAGYGDRERAAALYELSLPYALSGLSPAETSFALVRRHATWACSPRPSVTGTTPRAISRTPWRRTPPWAQARSWRRRSTTTRRCS